MNNVLTLPMCGACEKVVHKPIHELGDRFHVECWNEIAEDLQKVGEKYDGLPFESDIHNYTPTLPDGVCLRCNAPSKRDCVGENLREAMDTCDL